MKTMNLKKHAAIILALFATIFLLASCGSSETAPEDRVYLEGSDIEAAISDGDAYKGKWIKITGKVFNMDTDGDKIAIQAWYDPVNANQPFMVYATKDME